MIRPELRLFQNSAIIIRCTVPQVMHLVMCMCMCMWYTVEPPNKGRVGTRLMSTIQRLSFIGGFCKISVFLLIVLAQYCIWYTVMIEEEKTKIQWLQYRSKVFCVSVDTWYAANWSVNLQTLVATSKQPRLSQKIWISIVLPCAVQYCFCHLTFSKQGLHGLWRWLKVK